MISTVAHGVRVDYRWPKLRRRPAKATLAVRFRENPTLAAAIAGPPVALPNWGERNYFTWPEVEKWKIGDFVTSASRA